MNKNDFKYTIEKNKDKIILGVSIVGVLGLGFGFFSMVNNNKTIEQQEDEVYVDLENIRAEYIISGNDKGELDLINVNTTEVVSNLNLNATDTVLYSRSNDLEKLLAFTNNTFYEVIEQDGQLKNKEIFKLDTKQAIKNFKFSDQYIVANTGDKLLVFKLDDKSTYMIDVKDVDSMVVVDNILVFAEKENIHTYNLTTKETKKIEIGDKTKDLIEVNGQVIAFNNFGSQNSKSTILELKPNDLYIEKAHRHDNNNLIPIANDSDDKDISYIDKSNKTSVMNSHYTLDLNSDKETKDRVELDVMSGSNTDFNSQNTVSTKGYLYSNKSGKIEIFRLNGETIDTTIDTDKTFFMPISEEIDTNNNTK